MYSAPADIFDGVYPARGYVNPICLFVNVK